MGLEHLNRDELEREFFLRLREQLERGAREYGDASFERPLEETCDEILDELVDVAGWAFVMWVQMKGRLDVVRTKLREVERETERDGASS